MENIISLLTLSLEQLKKINYEDDHITNELINAIEYELTTYQYEHLKSGNIYALYGSVINATDEQNGQQMVVYGRNGNYYVRERNEFFEKFNSVNK